MRLNKLLLIYLFFVVLFTLSVYIFVSPKKAILAYQEPFYTQFIANPDSLYTYTLQIPEEWKNSISLSMDGSETFFTYSYNGQNEILFSIVEVPKDTWNIQEKNDTNFERVILSEVSDLVYYLRYKETLNNFDFDTHIFNKIGNSFILITDPVQEIGHDDILPE